MFRQHTPDLLSRGGSSGAACLYDNTHLHLKNELDHSTIAPQLNKSSVKQVSWGMTLIISAANSSFKLSDSISPMTI